MGLGRCVSMRACVREHIHKCTFKEINGGGRSQEEHHSDQKKVSEAKLQEQMRRAVSLPEVESILRTPKEKQANS